MQTIDYSNDFFVRINQAALPATMDVEQLIQLFVAPAGRAKLQDALLSLKLDLIEGTVKAAGLSWKDPD